MRKLRRRQPIVESFMAVRLLPLAALLAFGLTAPALAQDKPIKIALIQDKTGPLEAYAKQVVTGFTLGLDYATKGTMTVAGRKIEVELDLEKLSPVSGNPAELREALTNLIFNAVDAMPAGGTVTLRSRAEDNAVLFEISDTGTGMSEDVRTRCLEPFFSTKGDKGTGLGLSMVFGIIKRHNGTLDIESAVNRGSTFRIRFPAESNGMAIDGAKVKS